MSTAREKVLELISTGKITPAEGDALLGALDGRRQPAWRWLFLPMEVVGTAPALAGGVAVPVVSLLLTRLGIRFDGAFDMHLGANASAWSRAAIEQLIAWPFTALVFWAAARAAGARPRLVDALAMVAIARVPLVAAAALMVALTGLINPKDPTDLRMLVAGAAIVVPLAVWSITLFVTGLRTVAGLRGPRLALFVIPAIVVAELVSKLILAAL